MKKIIFIMIVVYTIAINNINGQLKVSGELRPRTELRDGYKTQATDSSYPEILTSQRTRISFDYVKDQIKSKISFQDVRTWGENPSKNDLGTIGIQEAWLEFTVMNDLSLKLGRQELSYDDERLLARCNWNNVGNQHDLALLKYSREKYKIHAGSAFNNEDEKQTEERYYALKYYKYMGFGWFSQELSESFHYTFIGIADLNAKENYDHVLYPRVTFGPNVYVKKGQKFDVHGNFYKQVGKDKKGRSVNAFLFSADLKYAINEKLSVKPGFEYYSGNDGLDSTNAKNNNFDVLYGSSHKHLGYMDYFPHSSDGGISDAYLRINNKIGDKSNIELTCHYFSLTNNLLDQEALVLGEYKTVPKYLGSEVDVLFDYNYSKELKISMMYSLMADTKSMNYIKGGNYKEMNQWICIMLTYKPEF